MVPRLFVRSSHLSHQAFRLYVWFLDVCGDDGTCYATLETLAKACSMRKQSVVDARNELERARFIQVTKDINEAGHHRVNVTIVDVWEKNNQEYDGGSKLPPGNKEEYPAGYSTGYPGGNSTEYPTGNKNKTPVNETPINKTLPTEGGDKRPHPRQRVFLTDDWHGKWASRLREVLVDHDADLVNPSDTKRRGVRTTTLANMLFRLETERKVTRPEVESMIRWLRDHYGEDFVPGIHKANDLRDKWRKFADAKQRWESDERRGETGNGNGRGEAFPTGETRRLAREAVGEYDRTDGRHQSGYPSDRWLDEWLKVRGLPLGRITRRDVKALDVGYAEA